MSDVPGPYFRLDTIDGVTIVHLVGPKLVPEARESLFGLVEGDGHRKLLLDFADIHLLPSAAVAILMGLQAKLEAAGGALKLCRLDPELLTLFRLTRLDERFTIHNDEQGALAEFGIAGATGLLRPPIDREDGGVS